MVQGSVDFLVWWREIKRFLRQWPTTKEAAAAIGIGKATVYQWREGVGVPNDKTIGRLLAAGFDPGYLWDRELGRPQIWKDTHRTEEQQKIIAENVCDYTEQVLKYGHIKHWHVREDGDE